MLPQQYRQVVIDRCHRDVAHSGFDKTLARVQETYIWPGMRRAIRTYLRACTHCNTLAPPKPPIPRGQVPTPPRPWHTWGIDLVGPFPRDQRGRQYLLTCVDHLTGWAEAIPIRSKSNKVVWDTLATEIISRYGIPSVILSDNGGEFTAKPFEAWLREFGITHLYTSPYHPQTNGKCERFNGTIQKMLLKLTGGNPRKWSLYLPDALYAYRISKGPDGVSPYVAIHGQQPRLPKCLVPPQVPGERLRNLHHATQLMKEGQAARKQSYQSKQSSRAKTLIEGMFVSVRVLAPKKGTPHWKPGYQVTDVRGPALVLREISTGKTIRVNQENVREIPESLPYEEVDPLPPKASRLKAVHPEGTEPIPLPEVPTPLIPHIPMAAVIHSEPQAQKVAQQNCVLFVQRYLNGN